MEHPYRTGSAVDAPRRRIDSTQASALPLVVMAVAFFLPAARGCGGEVVSPVSFALRGPVPFMWLTPIYVGAALMALAIVLTYARRRTANALAGSVTALAVGSATFQLIGAAVKGSSAVWYDLAALPATLVMLLAWRRAYGLRRLELLIDAFAIASLPVVVINVQVAAYYGAYVFVGAYALLALIRIRRIMQLNRFAAALRGAPRGRARERLPAR